MKSSSILTELRERREKRLRAAERARRWHKGSQLANRAAQQATTTLLRAEIKARPKTPDKPVVPDMFEGTA